MDVHVFDNQSSLKLSSKTVQAIATQVVAGEDCHYDEVSVYFVDKSEISKLHEQFFNDPTPTDCISFPMDDKDDVGYRVLGDIFVCPQVALEYSEENKVDPFEETTLYIVHGLLHLLGYDDIEKSDIEKMRSAEQRHLSSLKKLGLILQKGTSD